MLTTNFCNYDFSNPDQDIINRPNGSPEYVLIYFQTPMFAILDDKHYDIAPNTFLIIPPYVKTYYGAPKAFKNSFAHITGDAASLNAIWQKYPEIPLNRPFTLPDPDTINVVLREIYREYMTKNILYEDRLDNLISSLFIQITRQLRSTEAFPFEHRGLYDIFQKARMTILTRCDEMWDVESMARLTNLASSQFYHYYHEFFQISPKAELLNVRLERARYMLIHESHSIATIAEYSGFNNLAHFTRYFKKEYGITPGEYRKNQRTTI